MEMTKIQCIYIERLDGEQNAIETELQIIGGIRVGIIRQVTKKKAKQNNQDKEQMENNENRKIDKQDKKLLKVIKKLCDKETVIVANEKVVQDFAIPNTLFELKKKELLENATGIIEYLWGQTGNGKRKTFLLIIHSKGWNRNEVEELLIVVKNRYENIYIDNQAGKLDVEDLAKFFYEEYGIVLHFIDSLQTKELKIDTVFFMIRNWKEEYAMISYCNGYVVAEFENNQKRRRKKLNEGLAYSYCGKQIPYELAVALKYHEYLRCLFKQNDTKNEISIVAICGVEWYN